MKSFVTSWTVLTVIATLASLSHAFYDTSTQAKRCTEQKSYKMLGYFCNNLELEEIPRKMRSSIEILDVSHNRIRKLNRDSFAPCKDVKYLYLQMNVIVHIDNNTFADLKSLEVLDLSQNAIRVVPFDIFDLPYLRNLYLEQNTFDAHSFRLIPKVIKAPLKKLNIANNGLDEIPAEFGILPELYHLNISSNSMYNLSPQQFSPFCNVKEVDLNKTSIQKCKCLEVVDFLTITRHVEIYTFYCKVNSAECQHASSAASLNETADYQICINITRQVIANNEAKLTWGIVGISVLSFMIFFIGCLYCIHRRNVRQMQRRAKSGTNGRGVIKVVNMKNEANNADDSNTNTNPENLLIKRSDV